jgi:hypothetical protein
LTPEARGLILNDMSEALDDTRYVDRRAAPEPRLRFTPDKELTEYLSRFMRPESVEAIGRAGLFLYADEPLGVNSLTRSSVPRRGGTESPELSMIARELRDRGSGHRELARSLQPRPLPKETPGVTLHVDVILHELTAAKVMGLMRVNPDCSVGAHVSISRERLVGRQAYLVACQSLYERLLEGERRPGIRLTELIRAKERPY